MSMTNLLFLPKGQFIFSLPQLRSNATDQETGKDRSMSTFTHKAVEFMGEVFSSFDVIQGPIVYTWRI